jgi:hypothetical protein
MVTVLVGSELASIERRRVTIIRKLVVATLFALLLFLLGIFGGLGYRGYAKEISMERDYQSGFANVGFTCEILYDPITYPSYWIMGSGYINTTMEIPYAPQAHYPGEGTGDVGAPMYGNRKDRESEYLISMLIWGAPINLIVLLSITIAIEAIRIRSLYLILLSGILGFYVFNVPGVLFGVVAGSLVVVLLFRLWRDNFIVRFWRSLWEEQIERI